MDGEIVLRLSRMTAEDLAAMLNDIGEHLAAGAPIANPSAEEAGRLGLLLQDLHQALGRRGRPGCDHFGSSTAPVTRHSRSTVRER